MPSVRVAGFLPSQSGLHFPNYFPHESAITIPVPGGRQIGLGDAANGLCGGMAYAVRDYFESGQSPPPDTQPPGPDTPLFKYLVDRLLDSFSLPIGVLRYCELMSDLLPDFGSGLGVGDIGPHSRAWIMVRREWPRVRADLDNGRLATLGLIEVRSSDPSDLGKNHQVLAYGYDLNGNDVALSIYDPNYPDNDAVTLAFSIANPDQPTPVTYLPAGTVYCFFRSRYLGSTPP